MIAVIDYGAGNLHSVTNVLDVVGADYVVTNEAAMIAKATKIILPGVGHFGQLTTALDQLDLRAALTTAISGGVPYLGVCLGMQLLYEGSDEAPNAQGLGVFADCVRKFESCERIPHMGWNTLVRKNSSRLVDAAGESQHYYFAHSYFCPLVPATTYSAVYDIEFSAVVEQDNVMGVQFHPEKSGQFGIDVIGEFVGM